ncbi:hypothetical protein O0I10_004134 [Lichtheimia ornata]|uniref:Coiled-coil SMC6 And NSE5 INteracting (CANIN) domain-containing protein n=1 Tax=Lichtheimia ornata TaxID=688661 RepID=A0AAD7V9A4_9FUNG|nr:uncharacterized protein O0I10_004134 [Lichtheimia ornata]KAJ8660272.1 hypothetical protein O0I10_004134 [Lichtheimia ornata]
MELRRSHRIRVSDYTENRTGQSTGHEENDNDNDDDYNEERVVVQKYKSRKRPSAKLPEVESIDTLISAKRQRSQFVDKSDQLQLLFAQLNDAPATDDEEDGKSLSSEEESIKPELRERQDLLDSDHSDNDSEVGIGDILASTAQVLDEERHERLKEVFTDSPAQYDNKTEYRFFRRRCKLPDPLWVDDNYPLLQDTTRQRENSIFEFSSSASGRKFMLSSGCLRAWYRREWPPHHLYQWLFQVVAFEEDQLVAHHAYETLNALWKNLGPEPAAYIPSDELGSKRNTNRHVEMDEFIYVLKNYGAVKSEMAKEDGEIPRSSNNPLLFLEDWSDQPGEQRIPVIQLSYILRLFGYSVRTWPEAYQQVGIGYIIRLLLQISLDRSIGNIVRRDLQDGIESCLSVLDKATWKNELLQLAADLCSRFTSITLQCQLIHALKPTYARSVYLRRMIGLTAIMYENRHVFHPPPPPSSSSLPTQETTMTNTSNSNTPNGTCSDNSSGSSSYETAPTGLTRTDSYMSVSTMHSDTVDAMSIAGTPIADREMEDVNEQQQQQQQQEEEEEYPLPRVEPENILEQLLRVIENPASAFQQRDHDDYDELLAQIQLVDAAIGGRELEMLREQPTIKEIIRHLQVMNRRIGGRSTGVLPRIRASAAVQRVWNRLAYATGRESAGGMDEA